MCVHVGWGGGGGINQGKIYHPLPDLDREKSR